MSNGGTIKTSKKGTRYIKDDASGEWVPLDDKPLPRDPIEWAHYMRPAISIVFGIIVMLALFTIGVVIFQTIETIGGTGISISTCVPPK